MITEDQSRVIEFLTSPSTHGGVHVDRIDTHTAILVLAGSRVYKLKRAVRFDYLDFSTPERRRHFCDAEVRLNRRTAASLYRGVLPITREGSEGLALGGTGAAVDWVVEMNRFPQEGLFDRLAAEGRLNPDVMPPLASAIASFHALANRRSDHGGRAGMAWVIEGNAAGLAEFGDAALDASACALMTRGALRELDAQAQLLETRRTAGFVRECHGDLHLRNIVLLDGRPTLFDCIEFNERLSCTDVLYDLAFLLMDLWRRALPAHANAVWNRYLFDTGDIDAAPLLPLFLSCRAAVRSKTSATAAHLQSEARRKAELQGVAREYLAMAEAFLHPPAPRLIAIGGFSGSGKSVLARSLAPGIGSVPGATILRSDEIRKQLRGMRTHDRLEADAYAPAVSRLVYETMQERATRLLRSGLSVIVDGVYARPEDRSGIEHVAATASVSFDGLWLDAPESTLIERIERRQLDASDANVDVVRTQRAQGAGRIGWHRLDASIPLEQVRDRASDCLHAQPASTR